MTYQPTRWNDGDTITAEKMNHLEQGVAQQQAGPAGPQGPVGPAGPTGAPGQRVRRATREILGRQVRKAKKAIQDKLVQWVQKGTREIRAK